MRAAHIGLGREDGGSRMNALYFALNRSDAAREHSKLRLLYFTLSSSNLFYPRYVTLAALTALAA